ACGHERKSSWSKRSRQSPPATFAPRFHSPEVASTLATVPNRTTSTAEWTCTAMSVAALPLRDERNDVHAAVPGTGGDRGAGRRHRGWRADRLRRRIRG